MPRLNVVEPEQAQGKTKELFNQEVKDKGRVLNIFKAMGNSPAALKAYLDMAATLAQGELLPEDREVIYLGVSQANNCNYCVSAHTGLAKKAGMTDDQIKAIRQFDPLSPKHAALLSFVRRVMENKGFVSDADVAAVRSAGYTDGQLAESIAYIGLATYSNYFNHVHDTPLDLPQAPAI
jgi:uncharacterized peroxidase-related enzyme